MRCSAAVCVLTCFGAAASMAVADVAQFGAVRDNTLIQSPTGSVSAGALDGFFAGRNNQPSNSVRRGVIAFDLTSIPAGSVVESATLRLYLVQTNAADTQVTLHRMLGDWGEAGSTGSGGGGGGPAQTGDATWLHSFFNDQFWSTPGGDFTASPSAAAAVGLMPGFYAWSGPGLLADVQAWVDAPTLNHGWLLMGDESFSQSVKRFASRENQDETIRPVLEVTYTVPAPGAAGLVLAGLGLISRRRR